MNRLFSVITSALFAIAMLFGAQIASAATLQKHQTLYSCADNQLCVARIQYDFANDGGATGALDIATAGEKLVVVGAWTKVIAAGTSGGSATLKWGVTGDDDRFLNTTQGAVASLTLAAAIMPLPVEGTPNVIATPYTIASGEKFIQTIGTAALTAGKFEYVILYFKP
jgi:hypothetical protein